jgi:hypothetical protein
MVRHLLALDAAGWTALRKAHTAARDRFVAAAPATAPAHFVLRWARSYAVLHCAGELLERLFPDALEAGTSQQILLATWADLCGQYAKTSLAERALDAVREFVAARLSDFEGAPRVAGLAPPRETVGRISDRGTAILPSALEDHLSRHRLSLDTCLRHWREKGWIRSDGQGNPKTTERIRGKTTRVVSFLPGVLEGDPDGEAVG